MLFKTVDEIKEYIAVNVSTNIKSIGPSIRQAEEKFIKPVLGTELYTLLTQAYDDEEIVEGDDMDLLLKKVRVALGNFAYLLYIPIGQVQISETGIHISVNENKKAAFEHQVNKLELSFFKAGWEGLETLLAFLEENKDTYPDWETSSVYAPLHDCFINTAVEFNKHYHIAESRSLFVSLRPIMKRAELTYIKPILCKEQFDFIKDEIYNGATSDEVDALLEFIRPAVALLTLSKAVTSLPITLNAFGVVEHSIEGVDTIEKVKSTSNTRLDAWAKEQDQEGQSLLQQLREFIVENIDDYPMIKNSSCYNSEDPLPVFQNDTSNSVYFAG